MKKELYLLIIGSIILTSSCNMRSKKNSDNTNSNKIEKMKKVIYLNRSEFLKKVANFEKNPQDWEYLGDRPCIIDFYADWCGPCKVLSPILEELAEKYEGQIYIYKINTEQEQQLSGEFGIRSIPTLLFCPIGEDPQMAQGVMPKDSLKKAIDDILLKKK